MRPESTSISLRRDLSEVSQEYAASRAAARFIGRRVAPIFRVDEQTANYPIINREAFKKMADMAHADGAAFNRIIGEFGAGTYSCDDHGLEYPLTVRRVRRYRTFIDAEQAGTRILTHQALLRHEKAVADVTLNNTDFTTTGAATVWSTSATAVPLDDLITGANTLEDKVGIPRSEFSLIIPRADFAEMMATTQVTNKSTYTYPGVQPAELTAAQVAAMLQIKEVLICSGVYDSAPEGETESNAQIWTAGAVMLAILAAGEDAPLEMPAVARTMLWTRNTPDLPIFESYRDDAIRADVLRVLDDTDEVLTAELDLCAYRLST